MKLGKLIIAGLCVFSLCSFSTVAPVQVDATSYSTSINSVPTTRDDFYHPEQHADKNLYSYAFRLGVSGMSYETLSKRYPYRLDNESFISGFMDGSLCHAFIYNQRGSGRDNNDILE